jgi:hypothetical protein
MIKQFVVFVVVFVSVFCHNKITKHPDQSTITLEEDELDIVSVLQTIIEKMKTRTVLIIAVIIKLYTNKQCIS